MKKVAIITTLCLLLLVAQIMPVVACKPRPKVIVIDRTTTIHSSSGGSSDNDEAFWERLFGMENRLTPEGYLSHESYKHPLAFLDDRYQTQIDELRAEIAELKESCVCAG